MAGLRILMISQNPTSKGGGGSDMVFLQEIALLEEAGHTVMPFSAWNKDGGDLQDRFGEVFPRGADFENPSVKDYLSYLYNSEARERLDKVIQEFKPDICHLHIYYGKLTGSILKPLRMAGVPCIQTLHDYRYSCSVSVPFMNNRPCGKCSSRYYLPAILNRCNRQSVRRSALSMLEMYVGDALGAKLLDRYLCVSKKQHAYLTSKGLSGRRSSVVYNSVDQVFQLKNLKRDIDVLYVGRIEKYKGIDLVLDVASSLPRRSIRIVGTGGYVDEARERARDLLNVTFTGALPKPDVAELMSRSKCLLVPSQWEETFGLISAEAMACGTPVIASRIGGIPEVVVDGECGFLVDPADLALFIERTELILGDDELWNRLASGAVRRVAENFSAQAHLVSLLDNYQTAMMSVKGEVV